jgi:hypothetical protein
MGEMKDEGRYPRICFHGQFFREAISPCQLRNLWLEFYLVDPNPTQKDEIMQPNVLLQNPPKSLGLQCLSTAAIEAVAEEEQPTKRSKPVHIEIQDCKIPGQFQEIPPSIINNDFYIMADPYSKANHSFFDDMSKHVKNYPTPLLSRSSVHAPLNTNSYIRIPYRNTTQSSLPPIQPSKPFLQNSYPKIGPETNNSNSFGSFYPVANPEFLATKLPSFNTLVASINSVM